MDFFKEFEGVSGRKVAEATLEGTKLLDSAEPGSAVLSLKLDGLHVEASDLAFWLVLQVLSAILDHFRPRSS